MYRVKREQEQYQKEKSQQLVQGLGAFLHQLLPKDFPKIFLDLKPPSNPSFKSTKNKKIIEIPICWTLLIKDHFRFVANPRIRILQHAKANLLQSSNF